MFKKTAIVQLWCLLLSCLMGLSFPAYAEEEAPIEPQKSFFEAIDDAFGSYLVGPLAGVMFYDIAFWDNELTMGETSLQPLSLDIDGQAKGKLWDVVAYEEGVYDVYERTKLRGIPPHSSRKIEVCDI